MVSSGDVDMKAITVLDPLGNPIPFGQTITVGTFTPGIPLPDGVTTPPATSVGSDYQIISTINGLSDGQLHVDNTTCPTYFDTLCNPSKSSVTSFVQFYKEYIGQVELCIATNGDSVFDGYPIARVSQEESNAEQAVAKAQNSKATRNTKNLKAIIREFALRQRAGRTITGLQTLAKPVSATVNQTPAAPSLPSTSTGGGGGAGVANSGAAGAMPQVTLSLQPGRISAMIDRNVCETDQIVLSPETEVAYRDTTREFTHIEWRSIAEVIQYLGALVRNPSNVPTWGAGDNLFRLQGDAGRISVVYRGARHYVGSAAPTDKSLQALAMLNELITIAKISGSLPVTQPVQVLP